VAVRKGLVVYRPYRHHRRSSHHGQCIDMASGHRNWRRRLVAGVHKAIIIFVATHRLMKPDHSRASEPVVLHQHQKSVRFRKLAIKLSLLSSSGSPERMLRHTVPALMRAPMRGRDARSTSTAGLGRETFMCTETNCLCLLLFAGETRISLLTHSLGLKLPVCPLTDSLRLHASTHSPRLVIGSGDCEHPLFNYPSRLCGQGTPDWLTG